MQDRPSQAELLESIRLFLETEVLPDAGGAQLRFRTRVAANLLGIMAREVELEGGQLVEERRRLGDLLGGEPRPPGLRGDRPDPLEEVQALEAELARRIRAGEIEAGPGSPVWAHLRRTAVEKLRIANPAYLKRLGEDA